MTASSSYPAIVAAHASNTVTICLWNARSSSSMTTPEKRFSSTCRLRSRMRTTNWDVTRETGMEVPGYGPYAEENWPNTEKGFAAMVTRMDRDIGRIMTKLKELGIDKDTIVVFSSDNGPHREGGHDPEFFGSRGGLRGIKRDLYEGGIRVPAIARWPGQIQAGAVSGHPWAFWDFLPTAAELAGTTTPGNIDGTSIVPTLLGKEQSEPGYLYWEFCPWRQFPSGPSEKVSGKRFGTDSANRSNCTTSKKIDPRATTLPFSSR